MILSKPQFAVAAMFLFLGTGGVAQGSLILELSNGSNSVTITDGGAGDLSGLTGQIEYFGTLGGANFDLTVGRSFPVVGSDTNPTLELQSIHVEFFAAGEFTIRLTETEFQGAPSDPARFITSVNSQSLLRTQVGVASYLHTGVEPSWGDPEALAGELVSSLGPQGGTFVASDEVVRSFPSPPFSASLVATISSEGAHQIAIFNAGFQTQAVAVEHMPEPHAAWIWGCGLGLAGLVFGTRRIPHKTRDAIRMNGTRSVA
jgi:hypothetical protein